MYSTTQAIGYNRWLLCYMWRLGKEIKSGRWKYAPTSCGQPISGRDLYIGVYCVKYITAVRRVPPGLSNGFHQPPISFANICYGSTA